MQLISVFSLSFLEFRKMKKKVEDRDFKVTQRENILPIIILKKILSLFLIFKSSSHLPKKKCFIYFNGVPLKLMKNTFYFILKALFVLKIFKLVLTFQSLEIISLIRNIRLISKFMKSQSG